MKKPSLTLALVCFIQLAFGQNVTSAIIGHTFTDNNTIAISFDIHTTATTQNIPDSSIQVFVSDVANKIHIPVTNFKRISQVTEGHGCDSTNDTRMHQYAASVNLTDSKYSALSNSCKIRGELIVSRRHGGTTSVNGQHKPMYVYDEFEICALKLKNRNSYRTVSNGIFYSCLNQPTAYNLGAFDIAEFDSLSFELVNPMITRDSTILYTAGLSAQKPIDVSASTQFSFDSSQGEFVFYPKDTNQNLASVSVITTEWRRNNAGIYTVVGTSMREVLILIDQCQSNNPPVIKGLNTVEVCEGEQICFNISTDDKRKILPPPFPLPKQDSVTLKWNRGIPGATFTVLDRNALHQSARFCWTPKMGEASSLPYTFVATARDDFCPTNAVVNKSFSVYVTPQVKGDLKIRPISDTSFSVMVNIPTAHDENNYNTKISLEDVNGNPITNKEIGYFLRSNNDSTMYLTDTLIMRQSTKFRLTTTLSAKANNNCSTLFHDTLNFHTSSVLNKVTGRLNLYPNPTTGIINLDDNLKQVEVRNSVGELIWLSDESTEIDLTSYPSGMYTISGMFGDKWYSGKVIKY